LINQDDLVSSMLYSNYAIAYADLDLYLDKEIDKKSYFTSSMNEFFRMDLLSISFVLELCL